MAERAVADVVRQAGGVHQIRVAADFLAEFPPDLRAFQRMGEPGPREVGLAGRDDLGLRRQPAQPGAVQHAGPVSLEVTAPGPLGWFGHPAGRGAVVVTSPHPYLLPAVGATRGQRRAARLQAGDRDAER